MKYPLLPLKLVLALTKLHLEIYQLLLSAPKNKTKHYTNCVV